MKPILFLLLLLLSSVVFGQSAVVRGKVLNGTTGKPVTTSNILLLKPGSAGMETVASASNRSDFLFENLPLTQGMPLILRTTWQDVNYSVNVQLSEARGYEVDLMVYDTSTEFAGIHARVPHLIAVREGEHLIVEETLEFHNNGKTTFQKDGLSFHLPPGAHNVTLSTVYEKGLSVPAVSEQKGDAYVVQLPLKPGVSRIQIAFQLEYGGAETDLTHAWDFDVENVNVFVSPADVNVHSDQLSSIVDTELLNNNFSGFKSATIAAGTPLAVKMHGGSSAVHRDVQDVVAEDNDIQEAIWIILPLAVGLLLTALHFGIERRKTKESLIEEIAALDDRWASGQIAEDEYHQRRTDMKKDLLDELT